MNWNGKNSRLGMYIKPVMITISRFWIYRLATFGVLPILVYPRGSSSTRGPFTVRGLLARAFLWCAICIALEASSFYFPRVPWSSSQFKTIRHILFHLILLYRRGPSWVSEGLAVLVYWSNPSAWTFPWKYAVALDYVCWSTNSSGTSQCFFGGCQCLQYLFHSRT